MFLLSDMMLLYVTFDLFNFFTGYWQVVATTLSATTAFTVLCEVKYSTFHIFHNFF